MNGMLAYTIALVAALAGVGLYFLFVPLLGTAAPYLFTYPVVLLAALHLGAGPGLAAALLAAVGAEGLQFTPEGDAVLTNSLIRSAVVVITALYFAAVGRRLRHARTNAEAETADAHVVHRELQESHERYRTLVEVLPDALVVLDRGIIVECNEALCVMTGYLRDELLHRKFNDQFLPGGTVSCLEDGDGGFSELSLRRKDGRAVPVQMRCRPIAYKGQMVRVALIEDISERQGTERERREGEEMLRLVVESAPNAFVMVDEQGTIVLVNSQTEKVFGYARDELLGKPVEVLVPERVRSGHKNNRYMFHGDMHARPMGAGRDLYGLRKDGSEVPVEIGLNPIRTSRGVFVLAAIVDITQRKRAEEALREADRRKDEFLAILAHELRNPMAAISAAAGLLAVPNLNPETGKLAQESLRRRVTQLSRLVDDLLDVSRIVRGKIQLHKEPIDLAAVIGAAVEATKTFFEERGHSLVVRVYETLPMDADSVRLEQVLSNLLTNAAKYTDNNGKISLSAGKEDGQAVVRIKDNGAGIPPDMLGRVFDLFGQADSTLHRSQGGLGIGLTVARRLTELHGGSVSAYSEGPGNGSEFVVRLPLADRLPRPAEDREGAAVEPGLQVLVVEDHQDTAFMAAATMQLAGYNTDIANDGPSGVRKALEKRPDIILLDIGLPGLNGFEVAKQVREHGLTDTLIIAVTGYGQERDYERSRESGINHHLLKPVDYRSVAPLIARYRRAKEGSGQQYH